MYKCDRCGDTMAAKFQRSHEYPAQIEVEKLLQKTFGPVVP